MGACSSKKNVRKISLGVFGLDNAGKTCTTLRFEQGDLEHVAPTVGLHSSDIIFGSTSIQFLDLGGGPRFRSVWKHYYAEIYGAIFVVDSTDPSRFQEAFNALADVANGIRGKPILIYANKQDMETALSEADVLSALNVEQLANLYRCPMKLLAVSAMHGGSGGIGNCGRRTDRLMEEGLRWLLRKIDVDFAALSSRVEADLAAQRIEEAQQRRLKWDAIRRKRAQEADQDDPVEADQADDDVGDGSGNNPFVPLQTHLNKKKEDEERPKPAKKKTPRLDRVVNTKAGGVKESDGDSALGNSDPRLRMSPAELFTTADVHSGLESDDADVAGSPSASGGASTAPPLYPPMGKATARATALLEPLEAATAASAEAVAAGRKKTKKKKLLAKLNKTAPDPQPGAAAAEPPTDPLDETLSHPDKASPRPPPDPPSPPVASPADAPHTNSRFRKSRKLRRSQLRNPTADTPTADPHRDEVFAILHGGGGAQPQSGQSKLHLLSDADADASQLDPDNQITGVNSRPNYSDDVMT